MAPWGVLDVLAGDVTATQRSPSRFGPASSHFRRRVLGAEHKSIGVEFEQERSKHGLRLRADEHDPLVTEVRSFVIARPILPDRPGSVDIPNPHVANLARPRPREPLDLNHR